MRAGSLDGLEEGNDHYDVLPHDDMIAVGDLFFYPPSRTPSAPSAAGLRAYQAAQPDLPIVVDSNTGAERSHVVWAELTTRLDIQQGAQAGVDSNNSPVIRLFTFAVATDNAALFAPHTHRKRGVQYVGVEIHDWSTVNFRAEWRAATLFDSWRKVYGSLASIHMF